MDVRSLTKRRIANVIAIAVACASLSACVDLSYSRVPVDSPPPNYQPIACSPQVNSSSKPLASSAPKACDLLVRADAWITDSQLRVTAKEGRYCFEIPPGQVWFDSTVRATPPDPIAPSAIHKLASKIGMLRHSESGYMALMVGILPDARGEINQVTDLSKSDKCFTPSVSGTLVLYPNDAVGGELYHDHYYSNNHGQIWVRITRQ